MPRYDFTRAGSQGEMKSNLPRITFLSTLFLISAVMLYVWMYTLIGEGDINIVVISVAEVTMMAMGLMLVHIYGLARIEPINAETRDLNKTFAFGAIGLGILLVAQLIMQGMTLQSSLSAISASEQVENLHLIGAGVAEEFFFRAFLMGIFLKKIEEHQTAKILLSSMMVSSAFMAFHFIISQFDVTVLLITFVSSMILCVIYWKSGDLASPIIAHCLLNAIVALMT